MDSVNKDEALRAIDIGKRALQNKEYDKALRFFHKSVSLYETVDARNLISVVENLKRKGSNASVHRSTSAPSRSPNNNNNNSNTNIPNNQSKSQPPADHVKRIHRCKSFYDVLNVSRSVSANDLKKAYKKEALKVHPDKNKSDGAVAAFQKVTEAYETLSDERKREVYDQVGHDRYKDRVMRSGGDPTAAQGFDGRMDVTAEELFEMFFNSGAGRGGGVRFNHFRARPQPRRTMTPEEQEELQNARRRQQLFTVLPILFILIVWIAGSVFSENPPFSLQRSYTYPVKRTTGKDIVLDYFVEKTFDKRFPNWKEIQKIEFDVKREWLKVYEQNCVLEQRQREQQLFWASAERRQRINSLPLQYCEKYQKLVNSR